MLLEQLQIVSGIAPLALTTARDGDWVSLKNYRRCLAVFFKGIGTAGDDPTMTVRQATDVSGTSAKALTFADVYTKQDPTSLADVAQWTKNTRTGGAITNTYTDATSAEQQVLWAVEFKSEDLDTANDFDCIQVQISDVGTNAQTGCVLYIMGDPVNPTAPASMASAIGN